MTHLNASEMLSAIFTSERSLGVIRCGITKFGFDITRVSDGHSDGKGGLFILISVK
jgi:hypothetical protein